MNNESVGQLMANPRHERFTQEFVKTGNAAASYLAAGYKEERTRNSLDASASRLLRSGKVAARIQQIRDQLSCKTSYSSSTVQRVQLLIINELHDAKKLLAQHSGDFLWISR